MADPMRKEVSVVRKKIDSVNKELKPLGSTVQKKVHKHKTHQSDLIFKARNFNYAFVDETGKGIQGST